MKVLTLVIYYIVTRYALAGILYTNTITISRKNRVRHDNDGMYKRFLFANTAVDPPATHIRSHAQTPTHTNTYGNGGDTLLDDCL